MTAAKSVNGVRIRLTSERWVHITEEHCEMAGYFFEVLEALEEPEVVVYKEQTSEEGFVITAFLTKRFRQLARRTRVWPRSLLSKLAEKPASAD